MHSRWAILTSLLVGCVVGLYDPDRRIESARLYGNIYYYAYYFVDLLIGEPPQRTSVILDTGSGFCAFPCSGCRHCGTHIDPLFDFSKSKTANWVGCGSSNNCMSTCSGGHCSYRQSYLEGSAISGFWFEDYLRLGDAIQKNPPVKARLGCHREENKLFYTQKANGIFGVRGPKSPLQKLFADHSHVDSNIFSICLAHEGGRLTVGGHNQTYHVGPVQYIPMEDPTKYKIKLSYIQVGGRTVQGFANTIIDSGTTYTYLGSKHYYMLKDGVENYCKQHNDCGAKVFGTCYNAKNGLEQFPVIDMVFGNVVVQWYAWEYLYRQSAVSTRWCYAFQNDGASSTTTLGMSWMLYKEIIFDLHNGSVGIAKANCPEYTKRPLHSLDVAPLTTPTIAPGSEQPLQKPTPAPGWHHPPAEGRRRAPQYSTDRRRSPTSQYNTDHSKSPDSDGLHSKEPQSKPNSQFPGSNPEPRSVKMKLTSPSKEAVLAVSAVAVLTASVFTIKIRQWWGTKQEVKHVRVAQQDPDATSVRRACTTRPSASVMGNTIEY